MHLMNLTQNPDLHTVRILHSLLELTKAKEIEKGK